MDFVGAALGGGGERAALGAEDVHVEGFEGGLGEVFEGDVDLATQRVGGNGSRQLDVDTEAVEDEEEPIAIAGQRLAEIDGAEEGPGQDRGVDLDRAELGVLGALGFFGAAKARLGV